MQFFVFNMINWPYLEGPTSFPISTSIYDPRKGHKLYEKYLDLAELTESLGFDALCIPEHHGQPISAIPCPNIMASAVIQRTKNLKIAITGTCLLLRGHPLRVAEEIAMLDNMSGGRIISGFLRGSPREALSYNQNPKEPMERLEEAWDFVVKCWTSREPFKWEGKYYNYKNVAVWPRPYQEPHPPLIYLGTSADSAEFAARKRVGIGGSFMPTHEMKKCFDRYREICKTAGWSAGAEQLMFLRQVHVAETNEKARKEAESAIDYYWQFLMAQRKDIYSELKKMEKELGGFKPDDPGIFNWTEWWKFNYDICQKGGLSIIGDPEYVIDRIREQQEQLGAGTLICFFQWGSMPAEAAKKSMTLFAEKVMPAFK
jgi:alkanesulfonate monooxygenase SsuD/methylene tetrahydromethanopterin reductase-like flavin-dependent oxidoreductase (luciferase family)